MVIILVSVIDFARIYTTMLTIESAAREAADYGTFGSQRWDPALYPTVTVPQMNRRACVGAKNLPDYAGPDTACTNPTFSFELSGDKGVSWSGDPAVITPPCNDESRTHTDGTGIDPCWLKVNLHYEFHLLAPIHIEVFGVRIGLPDTIPIDRDSVFAMTDLELP